jgi:hypothetical protein
LSFRQNQRSSLLPQYKMAAGIILTQIQNRLLKQILLLNLSLTKMMLYDSNQVNRGLNMTKIEGAGGTSGGILTFFLGLAMTITGGFLFMNHVKVGTRFLWFFGRYNLGPLNS